MKSFKNLEVKDIFFLFVLTLILGLTFRLFTPFFNIILIAFVLVQIFHPIYKKIEERLQNKQLSTAASVLITLIAVGTPLTIIVLMIIGEISRIASDSNIINLVSNLEQYANDFVFSINDFFRTQFNTNLNLTVGSLSEFLTETSRNLPNILPGIITGIIASIGEILFNLFLLILTLLYLFPAYEGLLKLFSRYSPLDDEMDTILFSKFQTTTSAVIKGTFVVAFFQATAVIIPMIFLNIGATFLLWLLMFILSIIPIGSGLVWFPVGIALIITGISTGNVITIVAGILLIVYGAIIINVIDTFLRPRLMKNSVNLHPLVIIFSVIGGIALTNNSPLGVLYGPVIVVFFVSIMEAYKSKYANTAISSSDNLK